MHKLLCRSGVPCAWRVVVNIHVTLGANTLGKYLADKLLNSTYHLGCRLVSGVCVCPGAGW